jgi:hypothetical protein
MIICNPRSLSFALLMATLPMGFALAGGSGGGRGAPGAAPSGIGGGVGAAGMGSAAVGNGAPAGAVGGGPPAGRVGGGALGSSNPAGNGAAGTGNPSMNAVGIIGNGINASPGITNAITTGGAIGGSGATTGVAPPPNSPGGISPEALSRQSQSSTSSKGPETLQGMAEEQLQLSTTGLARPGPDGVSTVTVAPRPCGVAAHETDGTTTCIGIPHRRR